MQIDVQVPAMGESITEATVAAWHKQAGDAVQEGDILVELETDKVMVEVPATKAGILRDILKPSGEVVHVGDLLARIDTDGAGARAAAPAAQASAPRATPPDQPQAAPTTAAAGPRNEALPPAVQRMVAEHGLDAAQIEGTGRRGQVTKEDVVRHLERAATTTAIAPA
ncbi:MAG: E3 binding domain-containing protein, partial [Candidatus Lambdaproteobacteria bacterium]|nr:E3 binding domain-containing protein [Candidatus Lambdaproteobacteria bacterium]